VVFNSFAYILFLPAVVLLYYLLPHKCRWAFLLAASYFFYMCWNAKYALLMFTSTVITYVSGLLIEKSSPERKKLWVALSFTLNLSILVAFKYFNFFAGSLQTIFDALEVAWHIPLFDVLLPVGISFYTFQALSYTMDVYRGELAPVKHFGKYALFVSFFPQLVAGPIERSRNLIKQFEEVHRPDAEEMRDGLVMIMAGMFKKVVIADRLAVFVDAVYNDVAAFGGLSYILATFFFTFQIYCDFSGYSDIAIGSAKLMGFRLMKNFDRPYLSRSIGEFWRRWHISLSTWFRDYLYIPLGGSRVKISRWAINIMIVFLVSGLWHGANWTFVIWGGLHGLYQVIGKFTKQWREKLLDRIGIVKDKPLHISFSTFTTFVLVTFAWGFFRINNFSDAAVVLRGMFTNWSLADIAKLSSTVYSAKTGKIELLLSMGLIAFLFVYEILDKRINIWEHVKKWILPVRWVLYMGVLFSIILFGIYGEIPSFIYFQF